MAVHRETNLKQWQITPKAYSANATLTGTDSGLCATNLGAAGNITFTLPQALPNREFRFFVAAAHTVTVTPQSADLIRGKTAGQSYAAGTVGYYIHLVCVVKGAWELEFNIGPFT